MRVQPLGDRVREKSKEWLPVPLLLVAMAPPDGKVDLN